MKRVTVWMTRDLQRWIVETATSNGLGASAFARSILINHCRDVGVDVPVNPKKLRRLKAISGEPARAHRQTLYEIANGLCHYCKCRLAENGGWDIDHVVPLIEGGTNELSNLVASCRPCNARKGMNPASSIQ